MSAPRSDPNRPDKPLKIQAGGVKKGKNQGLKVVTANDLLSGEVVYFTAGGEWTRGLGHAQAAEGQDALDLLERASRDEAHAVGPYLMDVEEELAPSGRGKLREVIRQRGPTIHPEFAKPLEGTG